MFIAIIAALAALDILRGHVIAVADSHRELDALDALRVSQEGLALAMTGTNGGRWGWDTRSDALFVWDTVNQLFALPAGLQPATRRAYFGHIRVHPADKDAVRQVAADVLTKPLAARDIVRSLGGALQRHA